MDPLTGVWNEAGFEAAGGPVFLSCRRREAPVAVALFDFAADGSRKNAIRRPEDDPTFSSVMTAMARTLRKSFRASDVVGRTGAFRFAVLLSDCADDVVATIEGVRTLADRATAEFGLTVSVSMTRRETDDTLEALLDRAHDHAIRVRQTDERSTRRRERAESRRRRRRRARSAAAL